MSKFLVAGTLANLAATTGVSTHFGLRLQQEREKNPKDLGWENLCVTTNKYNELPDHIKDKANERNNCSVKSQQIQLHEYEIIVEMYNKFCKNQTFYADKVDLKTFCEAKNTTSDLN